MKIKKIKKTLLNFRIFIISFFLFTFSLPLAFSNQENPSGEELQKTKEIIISETKISNLKQGQKNFVVDGYNQKQLSNVSRSLIYTYQNQKGEVIYFLSNGKYCNLNTNICKNINGFSLNFVNVYDHRGYLVFFGSSSLNSEGTPSVHIFNKKTENFFNLDLKFYIRTKNPYYSNYDISYIDNKVYINDNFSFEIGNGNLRLYLLYRESSESLPSGKTKKYGHIAQVTQIHFDKLKDELFNPSRVYSYIYEGEYFDNYLENVKTKFSNNYQLLQSVGLEPFSSFARKYNERKNKEKSYGDYSLHYRETGHWSSRYVDYEKSSSTDYGIQVGYNLLEDGVDPVETYINSRGILPDRGVAYIDNWSSFFNGRDGKLWQLWIENNGDNNIIVKKLFNGFLGLNFSFNNYKVLSVKQDQEGYFYLSYLVDNQKLNTLVSKKIYRLNNEDIDYKLVENQYYLGNFNGIKLFLSDKDFFKNGRLDYYFPLLYLSRYGNNYNFVKFVTQGYGYNANDYVYTSNDRIFTENDVKMYFGGNFNLSNKPIETDHESLNQNGDTIENLNLDPEQGKKEFYKYFGNIPFLTQVVNLIDFSFPVDDWNTKIAIPYLKPVIENGKAKISYQTQDVNLQPIEDRLKISLVDDSDTNVGRKVISFFLAFIYLTISLILFYLPIFFIYYLFNFVVGIQNIFLPQLKLRETKGNIWVVGVLVGYILFFGVTILSFISITGFLTAFFSYVSDIIDLIFGFINFNFFDFYLFTKIIEIANISIIGLVVGYIGMILALNFGKVN